MRKLFIAVPVALVLAFGGSALLPASAAEPKERGPWVPTVGIVDSISIKNGEVKAVDLAKDAVSGYNVKDGTLYGADLNPDVVKWFTGTYDNTVTTKSVKDGALGEVDFDAATKAKLNAVGTGEQGPAGPAGAVGPKGDSYLTGAYYSVAYYDKGNTNAGAIATVACKAVTDTAISGGVSIEDFTKNTPVSSSFPGRMDWATNKPLANRLDGWIVQFGGNAGAVSDKDPGKNKIWALCVPGLELPVVQTYLDSEG